MHDINLSSLDLNLIPQLAALLRRRNVTHAANDVGLSQPAMSRALARLRDELGDLLLVRGTGGLVLTPKAERLRPRLEAALTDLKAIFRDETFDPATEKRVIRLAALDTQAVLIAPRLMARLATLAPGISLRIDTYTTDLVARMERGELDLAYALTTTPLPPGAMSEPVADDRYALVMRRGHPLVGKDWTLADYGEVDHAVVAIFGDGYSDLDALLASNGLSRRLAFMAPNFISVIAVVAATDLVTTISRTFARHMAPAFDLVVKEPPFSPADLPMTIVWSSIRTNDPVHAWFRALVREVTAEVYADVSDQALP